MVRVSLYVDSVDSIDSVSKELREIISREGLSSEFTVESSLSDFAKIMGPVHNLNSLGKIIIYSSIVASVIIIGLLVLLSLRERKHELGVFMALGETSYKVVGQVLIEVLLIALISLSLSMFSGQKIAQVMSDQMVQFQNISDKELGTYLGSDFSQQDVIDEYKVTNSATDARDIYLITLFSVALSTIIPTVYILSLNPKKILM
ncbi:MAG TPA: ABC transporter permease [Erysipelothrix sp.]|nr:ABC transporter permease [Erysipelothrix sp.]